MTVNRTWPTVCLITETSTWIILEWINYRPTELISSLLYRKQHCMDIKMTKPVLVTFLQSFDLVLGEGRSVSLQFPLQLKPHLSLIGVFTIGAHWYCVLASLGLWTLCTRAGWRKEKELRRENTLKCSRNCGWEWKSYVSQSMWNVIR